MSDINVEVMQDINQYEKDQEIAKKRKAFQNYLKTKEIERAQDQEVTAYEFVRGTITNFKETITNIKIPMPKFIE